MSGDILLLEASRHSSSLLNFFCRMGVPRTDCEDLLQETLLRLWKHRDNYVPTAKLSTFLHLIARQVWIDALRRTSRREARERAWMADSPETARHSDSLNGEDVRISVAKLPKIHRDVVEMAIYRDMPYAEIAHRLGIPEGTVKSRMSCAVKKLRAFLAASFAIAIAAGAIFFSSQTGNAHAAARDISPYALAQCGSSEAIAEIMRTQHPDGGWGSDFLTQRNAAALAKTNPASTACRRAIRNLRARGMAPAVL